MTDQWYIGDRARIKSDAFPGSTEPCDLAARGKVGVLVDELEDGVWFWRADDGTEPAPISKELETP